MKEREEKSAVPGTMAHRAHLRQLLDAKDQISTSITKALGLTKAQEDEIHQIIQAEHDEPWMSAAQVIDVMEDLLASPELTPEAVYERIDDYRSILLHHIAAKCYAAGVKSSAAPPNK